MTQPNPRNPHGFVVGQKVFTCKTQSRGPYPEFKDREIIKIGRDWATLEGDYRFELTTMRVDGKGYSPPFTVYLSEKHYEETTGVQIAWRGLVKSLTHSVPDGMTRDKIAAIKALIDNTNQG